MPDDAVPLPSDFTDRFEREGRPPCQLYVVSPPRVELPGFAGALARALEGGPVAAFQLRLKAVPDAEVLRACEALLPLCRTAGVAFLLNDRADLAQQAGADGVHLGQTDGSVADARALLGREAQIGVTCHASRHLAMDAGEAGANYVAFGAFFDTATKPVEHRADPEILAWWTTISPIPCVAIGGITAENCGPLVAAGADFLAVSGAVWGHPEGPTAGVRAFARRLAGGNRALCKC
jgi:thiamine-phosphate pyrophosphorylase